MSGRFQSSVTAGSPGFAVRWGSFNVWGVLAKCPLRGSTVQTKAELFPGSRGEAGAHPPPTDREDQIPGDPSRRSGGSLGSYWCGYF